MANASIVHDSRAKVFIGSSTKTKQHVTIIASWLDELKLNVWRWFDDRVFIAGQIIFPRLVEIANEVDAAIFVMGEDDDLWYRQDIVGKPQDKEFVKTPRDNVLIEYGLFSGVLKASQVIVCRVGSPKVASDLGGLVYVDLNSPYRAELQITEWAKRVRKRSGHLLTEPYFVHFSREFPNIAQVLETYTRSEHDEDKRILDLEKSAKFYTFSGLHDELREDDLFQDFDLDRESGTNINPVQFLWADSVSPHNVSPTTDPGGKAGAMRAWVMSGENCLRVMFKSSSPWPSNICLRAKDERALFNVRRHRYLSLEARVPAGQPEVALTVRLVNGWLQHWEYTTPSGVPAMFSIPASGEFKRMLVDLADQSRWRLFPSDGNRVCGPKAADFNVIVGVVLELGTSNPGARPGAGESIADIRDVRLVAH
jgi:hypothetical protein